MKQFGPAKLFQVLTIEELREILRKDTPAPGEARIALEDAAGHALAETITADRDIPPFDRAMMDGFALRAADAPGSLKIVEEIRAGQMSDRTVGGGECVRIMTGAPVPAGADAVIQHEKTEERDGRVQVPDVETGANISPRGDDTRAGERLLEPGHRLRPPEIAVAATMGHGTVKVFAKPTVGVIATGDELVPPDATPGPAQIRNSNGYTIRAQVLAAGFDCEHLGIARDTLEDLRRLIADGFSRHSVLILSGGVSAGEYDLVIRALTEEGVEPVAHKVRIKPGKPFFYGRRGAQRVFGLPGNPVSAVVTFEIFIRPYLGRMCGLDLERPRVRATLTRPVTKKIGRVRFIPARLEGDRVEPVFPASSGDIISVTRVNAFVIVPIHSAPAEGEEVEVMRYDA